MYTHQIGSRGRLSCPLTNASTGRAGTRGALFPKSLGRAPVTLLFSHAREGCGTRSRWTVSISQTSVLRRLNNEEKVCWQLTMTL